MAETTCLVHGSVQVMGGFTQDKVTLMEGRGKGREGGPSWGRPQRVGTEWSWWEGTEGERGGLEQLPGTGWTKSAQNCS